MPEFTYNNSITIGNGMSPFYANYGFHPFASDPAVSGPLNMASKLYTYWMYPIPEASWRLLKVVQPWMRRYMDPERTKP